MYVIQDADRAGGAVGMTWVDDPVSKVASITTRGVRPVDVEEHDQVWEYVFHEADGKEIGIGGDISSSG
ncbi:hypothetical protein [Modestobacter altitudinis]|uniref:hypothetical protein n=1 Tax=Modestobacter altitudinis TaxID=2213158 RepID=UPI00110CBD99|nr:hypothetical protein [Modestobacter altitudinis]